MLPRIMNRKNLRGAGGTEFRLGSRWRLIVACCLMFALALVMAATLSARTTPSARAQANGINNIEHSPTPIYSEDDRQTSTPETKPPKDGSKAPTPAATEIVNMTPIPEWRFLGWERLALRDLAEVNSWPTSVVYDSAGRLKVQNNPGENEWTVRVHVRAFDYRAGASAAFNAEQEDARLSGFRLTDQTFYTFRAYRGVITDRRGNVIEERFRWLARTWILGVDLRATSSGPTTEDPVLLSEQLLSLAVQRGLPPPPSIVPTPNPTWSLPPNPTPVGRGCNTVFSDVTQSYWAYGFITAMACDGTVTGYADGSFRPERSTTRAQLAKMLVLTQRWEIETPGQQSFRDVSPAHPFYIFIETAASHGVISGYGDNTYRPDAFVTRAQVAKMLVLARGWNAVEDETIALCDVTPDYWGWTYVQAALQNGLFTGYGNNCFQPDTQATRAQISKVLLIAAR